jgi:hypothetical protein
LIALDKKGYTTMWSIITGKVIKQKQIKGLDVDNYEIYTNGPDDITYKSEWYCNRILLVDHAGNETVDETEFYGDRLKSDIVGCASFV